MCNPTLFNVKQLLQSPSPIPPTPCLSGKGFVTAPPFPQHMPRTPLTLSFSASSQPFISSSTQRSHNTSNYQPLWYFLLAALHLVGVFSILLQSLTQPPCLSPQPPFFFFPFLASSLLEALPSVLALPVACGDTFADKWRQFAANGMQNVHWEEAGAKDTQQRQQQWQTLQC